MQQDFFHRCGQTITALTLIFWAGFGSAEPMHGIAMYGEPALPPDFVSLPYANKDAPIGGRIVFGEKGTFDSLNPFIQKGTAPWQLRFLAVESLMGRSRDEPFTLYGLLAESIETAPDRSWVEFTLRPEARFSDGSPVTVEDVMWSYEVLASSGHGRYRGFGGQVASMEQTGERSLRLYFATQDRELALIAGLRPILKKSQWAGKDFAAATLQDVPITSAPYVIGEYDQGRFVTLKRNHDYWGKDLGFRRGTNNFDEIRIEYFGDQSVVFEAFKAGGIDVYTEDNADDWATLYDFPRAQSGDVVKSEIRHHRPTGMTGFVMNTQKPIFADWRVREAMLLAFNFPYINGTMTGGLQPRITSYFANSPFGMEPGAAQGKVPALLAPFADTLVPGTIEGYILPLGDRSERNRKDIKAAMAMLNSAGWEAKDGILVNAQGAPFEFEVLLRQGDRGNQSVLEIYRGALLRLGITMKISAVDNAQFVEREATQDFDMTYFRRDLSLSPGNEQRFYWGSDTANVQGTRNVMGMQSKAADAMIDTLLTTQDHETFVAATQALDRVLTAGRYVIPIWTSLNDKIAHRKELRYPEATPLYGASVGWMPDVWWYEKSE